MSVISLYNKRLSEEDFKILPMVIKDYDESKKKEIYKAYKKFFEDNISKSFIIKTSEGKGSLLSEIKDLEKELEFFLKEELRIYWDIHQDIFFSGSFDLELIVYSKKPFNLTLSKNNLLFQREKNKEIKWGNTEIYELLFE